MNTTATAQAGPEEPPALIFQEERRARAHWRLGLMIFLALLAHAASFYVLQVAYTPTGSLLPPPARVVLIPLDPPENAALARWLALADPTLSIQSPVPAVDATLDSLGFHYVPSYEALPPAFKPLETPAPAESVNVPPRPLVPGPVPMNTLSVWNPGAPTDAPPPSSTERSRVILSRSIVALAPLPLPPVHLKTSPGSKPLDPTVFLVGIRPEGGMPFLFPVRQAPASNASTDADDANECARDYLSRLTFRPAATTDGSAVWGRATFYWGSDAGAGR